MTILNYNNFISTLKKITSYYGIKWVDSLVSFDLPKNVEGDLSFRLSWVVSNHLNKKAEDVSEEIISKIKESNYQDINLFNKGGYINIEFKNSFFINFLLKTLEFYKKNINFLKEEEKETVCLEYVSANPTGFLHLAHVRQGFIGDVLANIYRYKGYNVIKEYYINDYGKQIDSIVKVVEDFKNNLDISLLEYNDKEVLNKLTIFISENKNTISLREKIVNFFILEAKKDLEKSGIFFDVWTKESSLFSNQKKINDFIEKIKKEELVYFQDGSCFFKSALDNSDDKDRVIIKKDLSYTYFFSDILYHINKLNRANKLINIWGADHHGYINRVKSSIKFLGYNEERVKFILVQLTNLISEDGKLLKFSKRKNNLIYLKEAYNYIEPELLRFFCLEKSINQSLNINISNLEKQKEKTKLYYIKYALFRFKSLIKKSTINIEENIKKYDFNTINLLDLSKEKDILLSLILFEEELNKVINDSSPNILINYNYQLSQKLQHYYQNSKILTEKNDKLVIILLIIWNSIKIIEKSLKLLGFDSNKF